jgi:hypothetical protein
MTKVGNADKTAHLGKRVEPPELFGDERLDVRVEVEQQG